MFSFPMEIFKAFLLSRVGAAHEEAVYSTSPQYSRLTSNKQDSVSSQPFPQAVDRRFCTLSSVGNLVPVAYDKTFDVSVS